MYLEVEGEKKRYYLPTEFYNENECLLCILLSLERDFIINYNSSFFY